jgi:ligand-binding sensor domain-containing protein
MIKKIDYTLNLLQNIKFYSILILAFFVISCNGQNQPKLSNHKVSEPFVIKPENGFNNGFLDRKGIIWFGSNGGGVYRYDGVSFTNITTKDGLSNNEIRAIIEDNDGNIWFGTGNGLCKYDNKTFTHIPLPFSDTSGAFFDMAYPIINPNAVHSLFYDKRNNDIWIGTGGAGAYRYDLSAKKEGGKMFTSFLTKIGHKQIDSLHHNWITSITDDAAGNIWFSSMSRGGVSRLNLSAEQEDGENFTHFLPKDGLNYDMVRTVFTDKSGTVWLGYKPMRENGGITYYKNEKFTTLYEKDGLCHSNIRTIYEDKKGNLWFGGNLGNVCIYDGKIFREFKTKEGKTIYGILDILEDAAGNIWLIGDGLYRFDGENVVDFTNKRTE